MLEGTSALSSDLAERLAVRPPTVTSVVDGLVTRGLVERRTVEGDRRRVDHVLTDHGRQVLDAADAAVNARLCEIASHLDRPRRHRPRLRGADPVATGAGRLATGPVGRPMRWPHLRPRPPATAEVGTDVIPIAEVARNEAPRATIDPDQSLSWLRRVRPIMWAHKGIFITSLVASFIGLVLQVQIPNLLNDAITNSIENAHRGAQPLRLVDRRPRVGRRDRRVHLPAVPVRDGLRHRVRPPEHHLRAPHQDVVLLLRPGAVRPAHLTGQLGHPLGPDVHDLRAIHPGPVLASPSWPSASCSRSTCPWPSWPWPPCPSSTWRASRCGSRCSRCRGSSRPAWPTWPPSWTRTSTACGWSSPSPPSSSSSGPLAGAADKLRWSYIKDADLRARFSPLVQNLPQLGLALVLAVRRLHGHPRQSGHRGHPGLQRLPADAAGPVHDARACSS